MENHNTNKETGGPARPVFPKRAVITAGMPYGNKELHIGHIGAVFVHADTIARFLRDRIGPQNVIFVSGTDCYGSPIVENHRQLSADGRYTGTIEEFVSENHEKQKKVLELYNISVDLYAGSGIGRAGDIHSETSAGFINRLYENGHLIKNSSLQFYDLRYGMFLNGRQVTGKCPIMGCSSEKGYADECSLGHQYMPSELIDPISTLSGEKPEMREVTNWYFKLDDFRDLLKIWLERAGDMPGARAFALKSIEEFMGRPVIYLKKEMLGRLYALNDSLPDYELISDDNKSSSVLVFPTLSDRENACIVLSQNKIRYRTGKTLTPFRITGNIDWGVMAPVLENLKDLTVWVWPESLWAPISFTKAYLESRNGCRDDWKKWWCSKDAKVYQFLGIDNVYFYGPAEMAMFMGFNGKNPSPECQEGDLQLPSLIVNNHLLFLNSKASSSGLVKPPSAGDLLNHYTAEQLRSHFLGLGLGQKSVSFQPKAYNPDTGPEDSDPVLKEGSLFTNVFNRFARTCFYTALKYFDGRIPVGEISPEVLEESRRTVLEYERLMHSFRFHLVMNRLDGYIRSINKYAVKHLREADEKNDGALREKTLINMLHMLRTAAAIAHP
jgi:methionyl-tRNA synthetase